MSRPKILTAILSSILLAAPLIAVFYLGWRLFGFPFIPFDLFDALSRILPGPVITRAIESMVGAIRALNLGDTANIAKAAEQAMAMLTFGILLVAIGVAYLLLPTRRGESHLSLGLVLGVLLTLLLSPVIANGQTAQTSLTGGIAWSLILFAIWGLTLAWLRRKLVWWPVHNHLSSVDAVNRRQILIRLGEASALITVAGAVVGSWPRSGAPENAAGSGKKTRWSETHPLPNAKSAVNPAPGTRPEFTPLESHYRIDINTSAPSVKEETWRLRISGLVERPFEMSLQDIRKLEPIHQFVTMACISNLIAGDLIGTTRWTGVSVQRILQEVRPRPGARYLKISSADGFYEVVSMDAVRNDARIMLAYEWDGLPLAREHGFPLRIYIPDRYGMKQPKWIESIEFLDHPEEGYWVKRGWDAEARMRATSVIDTMSSNMMIAEKNSDPRIPLGGIAHAGARGISRVQIRVDQEPWQDALLRAPLSDTTWVVWRFDWPFKAGKHTFTVRCFEGNGTPQITEEAPPHPSGATGLHSVNSML